MIPHSIQTLLLITLLLSNIYSTSSHRTLEDKKPDTGETPKPATTDEERYKDPNGCKEASRFGKTTPGKTIVGNKSGYCPALQRTCCTDKSFDSMKSYWTSVYKNTTKSIKTFTEQDQSAWSHLFFTMYKMLPAISEIAETKFKQCSAIVEESSAKQSCLMTSKLVQTVLMAQESESSEKSYTDYILSFWYSENPYLWRDHMKQGWKSTAKKCWRYLADVKDSLFCATCHPSFAANLIKKDFPNPNYKPPKDENTKPEDTPENPKHIKKDVMLLNYLEAELFVDNCFGYILQQVSMTTLFNQIAHLLSYNDKGVKENVQPYIIKLLEDNGPLLELCIRNQENPKCRKIVVEEFSFSGLLKDDYKNFKSLKKLVDWIKNKVEGDDRKPEERRVLEVNSQENQLEEDKDSREELVIPISFPEQMVQFALESDPLAGIKLSKYFKPLNSTQSVNGFLLINADKSLHSDLFNLPSLYLALSLGLVMFGGFLE